MTVFRSLSDRKFLLLWTGQAISRLGDSIYRIALAWWVLEKTNSATAMGTVMVFSFIPTIFFSLIGGVTVDRLPRVRLMLLTDLVRGLVVTIIALLASARLLEVWHIYLASMAFGSVEAFFLPAYTSIIPELVPRENLTSANALTSLSNHVSSVAGPALGAWLISLSGIPSAFAMDGISFAVSIAFLLPLSRCIGAPTVAPSLGLTNDMREGLRFVAGSPWLWITITMAALGNITISAPLKVALPFLIKNNLHADVGALGIVYSSLAVGAVIGTVLFGRSAGTRRRGLIAYSAWFLGGLLILSIGLPMTLPVICFAALGVGALFSIFTIIWTTSLQDSVPRHLLGRVASIDNFGSYALIPVGFSLIGWVTDRTGADTVFMVAGGATTMLAALCLTQRSIRDRD